MRHIKYVALVMVAVIMLLALPSACGPAVPEEPIKIGVLLDYSGVGAGNIPFNEQGVRVKLDEIGWEIAGRKVELICVDNASDPVKGAEMAQRLVEVDKVDVVVGPIWSHVALAAAPIFAESKTPVVFVSCQPMAVVETGGGYAFLPKGTMEWSSYYAGVYAYEEMGYRTATVLHDDYSSGEALTIGFIRAFEERGGTIVQIQKPPLLTFDFAPYLVTMTEADVSAIWIIPDELGPFYTQYDEFGLEMPIIYTYIEGHHEIWTQVGDECIGTIGQITYSSSIDTDVNKRFVEVYDELGSPPCDLYWQAGYMVASIIVEALEATEGDTTPEILVEALGAVSVDVPEGRISFTPEGIGIGDALIVKVVKIGDRYETEVLKTYEQVVRRAPFE